MTAKAISALLVALSLPALAQDITVAGERGTEAVIHTQTAEVSFAGQHPVASAWVTHKGQHPAVTVRHLVTCEPCDSGWLCGGRRWIVSESGRKGQPQFWTTGGSTVGDGIAYDLCFYTVQRALAFSRRPA